MLFILNKISGAGDWQRILYTLIMTRSSILQQLRRYLPLLALYLAGPLFLTMTDPTHLPLPLLVVPFLWLFTALFITSYFLLQRQNRFNKRQVVMVSGVIATIPVLLAIFQSIHQLSLRDVLLSCGLVLLTAVYMLRADFIR